MEGSAMETIRSLQASRCCGQTYAIKRINGYRVAEGQNCVTHLDCKQAKPPYEASNTQHREPFGRIPRSLRVQHGNLPDSKIEWCGDSNGALVRKAMRPGRQCA